ncbi:SR-related and CTD-associated factor 8 [Salarias fasciatus]|uniref:SR-related and CTD-associated factor 8 n=1 Tax=Salarias fasciatus TaxID=181472 RepID=UPI0011765E37|nr:SR-related and CTD-associated factor 8 [Salarias fasciatus]
MEAVKAFNNELYSLNEYKPPISKAKMTQITKSGIKAIKFYKHVVQSVEKFIQKCKPEYKVPGLYVIDSIVRQSRHQFGTEKDVFAPRFSKNIIATFQHLYRCPSDDKSKIVRVLNLWQKNAVFKSDIIQPLLDMAAGIPPPSVTPVMPSSAAPVNNTTPGTPATPATPANIVQSLPDWASQITNTDTVAAVAQILQSPQGQQLQQLVQSLQMQQQKPQPSLLQALDAGLVVQLQALTAQLTAAATANSLNPLEQRVSSFNKKLLGPFDFGNDSERSDESKKDSSSSQLPIVSEPINSSLFHQLAEQLQQQNLEQFQKQLLEHQQKAMGIEGQDSIFGQDNSTAQGSSQPQHPDQDTKMDDSIDNQQQDMDLDEGPDGMEEEIFEAEDKKTLSARSRTRSRSRSRSPKRRRSRSRSGSRKRKHRKRSRSRSRDRKRKSSRSYSSERRAREREKERQKKGLPPIRSKTLSVCSTTLWVGQVDKKATQQDLTNLFEEFGQIESINMIPPRGCAYICMVHRQDAYRARQKLSTGSFKIGSKIIKIAWALNKGVKQEYKQFWDVDLGVTYIPWEKVKLDDLDGFAEGGIIDQETVNDEWEAAKNSEPPKEAPSQAASSETTAAAPNAPAEAYSQQVTMMPVQLPVAQAVPSAVGLVPPTFPVTMGIPPPGYGPPPPFIRAGFNASQPPPGFMQAAHTAAMASVTSSLVQPSVASSQDGVKESPFSAMIPPTSTIPGSFMPSALPGSGVFNPVGVPTQQASNDKTQQSAEGMDAAELTLQGMQNAVRSGMGLLGMHPTASLSHQLHQSGLGGQRMPGLLPLDVRPNLLQPGAAARFPLLMPQGPTQPAPGLLDSSLQARARAPFAQLDPFNRAANMASDSLPKTQDEPVSGTDEGKDQDYRFPPMEKPNAGLLRTPPVDHREPLGGGGGAAAPAVGGGGRPPLLQTPGSQPARTSLVGRLQALAGFTPDNRWNQTRGDFDERDGMRGAPQVPGGPKGFQEERPTPGQNFPNRFESRPGATGVAASVNAGAVGGPPAWNRSGGAPGPFDTELHQDLDERRRPWDRQRDRDERDFDFRRDMNGSRHSRERDRERERERERDRERGRERSRDHDRERDHDKERDRDRERERGGWTPLLPLPTPLLPTPPLNPNLTLNQGKLLAPLKLSPQVQPRFQSPLLPQAQAKPSLLGLNQPAPQVQIKSPPPPSQSQAAVSKPETETPTQSEEPQEQPPSSAHSPDNAVQSTPAETPVQSESPPQTETPPHSDSPSQPEAQSPPKATAPPETEPSSHASVLPEASPQDSPVAFTQAATPPEETSRSPEDQQTPPKDEEDSEERASSSAPQWVNGPGMDSVAEPTPEASPEPSPEASPEPSPEPPVDPQPPKSEPEPQQEPLASPKDVDSEQSEPVEEAASQPVVDTVTDTEGT